MKLTTCLVNPRACYETELEYSQTNNPKNIAIIGAGPAGLSTAIVAAERGHKVTLFDSAAQIGGQLNLAKQVPGKEEFFDLIDWYASQLDRFNVVQKLGYRVGIDDLTGFDEIVVSTGVLPRNPQIDGQENSNVLSYLEVLQGAEVGKKVAIIGAGGIGFDVAEYLATTDSPTLNLQAWKTEWGIGDPAEFRGGLLPVGPQPEKPERAITLLQRKSQKLGKGLGKTTGWIHRATLNMKNVTMLGGVNYERITAEGLWVSDQDTHENMRLIKADTIVLCAGQVPERSLADQLIAKNINCHVIGGADVASELDAKRAINQGSRLAAEL